MQIIQDIIELAVSDYDRAATIVCDATFDSTVIDSAAAQLKEAESDNGISLLKTLQDRRAILGIMQDDQTYNKAIALLLLRLLVIKHRPESLSDRRKFVIFSTCCKRAQALIEAEMSQKVINRPFSDVLFQGLYCASQAANLAEKILKSDRYLSQFRTTWIFERYDGSATPELDIVHFLLDHTSRMNVTLAELMLAENQPAYHLSLKIRLRLYPESFSEEELRPLLDLDDIMCWPIPKMAQDILKRFFQEESVLAQERVLRQRLGI